MKPVRKAVFPVAGLGTRFLPATKAMPKEMLTVVDKPLIQYAVEEALEAGVEQIIFVTGRGKSALEDHFDVSYELETTMRARGKSMALIDGIRQRPGSPVYIRQQEPLGLGEGGPQRSAFLIDGADQVSRALHLSGCSPKAS